MAGLASPPEPEKKPSNGDFPDVSELDTTPSEIENPFEWDETSGRPKMGAFDPGESEDSGEEEGESGDTDDTSNELRDAEKSATQNNDDKPKKEKGNTDLKKGDKETGARGRDNNLNKLRNSENSSGGGEFKGKSKTGGSKGNGSIKGKKPKGPIAIIITIVTVFIGGIGGILGTEATMFAALKANLTNSRDSGAPARNTRFSRVLRAMLPKDDNDQSAKRACAGADGGKTELCKSKTMDDDTKQRMKENGVDIESEPAGEDENGKKRSRITKIEIEDDSSGRKTTVKTQGDFDRELNSSKNSRFRGLMQKGYDSVKHIFIGDRFKKMISKKWGLSKGKRISGSTRDEVKKSLNDNMNIEDDGSGDTHRSTSPDNDESGGEQAKKDGKSIKEKVKGMSTSLSRIGSAGIGTICAIYTGIKGVLLAAKMIQILRLVSFGFTMLKAFDQIIAGDAEQEMVGTVADQLNYSETDPGPNNDNRFYGTTFTDAEGMRMLLHGDLVGLSKFASRYIVGGGFLGQVNEKITSFEEAIGAAVNATGVGPYVLSYVSKRRVGSAKQTGQTTIKYFCNLIGSKGAQIKGAVDQYSDNRKLCTKIPFVSRLAQRVGQTAGSAAFDAVGATVIFAPFAPLAAGAGYVAGQEATYGVCIGIIMAFVAAIMKYAVAPMLEKIGEWASDYIANMQVDSNIRGVDAGNALAAGVGLLLQNTALGSGLVYASKMSSCKDYVGATETDMNRYIAAEKYNARDTPFDSTNQYSFMGSMALNMYNSGVLFYGFNPAGVISSMAKLLPASLAFLGSTPVSAAAGGTFYEMRACDKREAQCPDGDANQTSAADPFCTPFTYMRPEALNWSADSVVEYMVYNQFIDKEGAPTDKPNGELFKKFNQYCVTRESPPGEDDSGGSDTGDFEDGGSPGSDGILSNFIDEAPFKSASEDDWATGYNCDHPSQLLGDDKEGDLDMPGSKVLTEVTTTKLAAMSAYTMDHNMRKDMLNSEDSSGDNPNDPRKVAEKILSNPNITFSTPAFKADMEKIKDEGVQELTCGNGPASRVAMSTHILNLINSLGTKYKIEIGQQIRGADCNGTGYADTSYATGRAIEVTKIGPADGALAAISNNSYTQTDSTLREAQLFMDATAGIGGYHLLLGGNGCFGNSGTPSYVHTTFVNDTCNHEFVGVRD